MKKITKLLSRSKERLPDSNRDEYKACKAIAWASAGLVVGIILFLVLKFNFDYSYAEAGAVSGVSAMVSGLAMALSTHCRCIVLLVGPNFFTGKGMLIHMCYVSRY